MVDAADTDRYEERDGCIGYTEEEQLLFVVSIERQADAIRIISARPATNAERRLYES